VAFNHDSSPYLRNTHFFNKSETFLKKNWPGGATFFQNLDSSVLPNSGLWIRGAGLHPAQILRPQDIIALKMPPAHARLMFSTKNCFFSDLAMPRPRPRLGNNHIGNLLPLEMCSLSPENDYSNKPHLH
jgi:hypothetical protein